MDMLSSGKVCEISGWFIGLVCGSSGREIERSCVRTVGLCAPGLVS